MKILNQDAVTQPLSSCCSIMDKASESEDEHHESSFLSLETKFIICLVFSLPLLSHMFLSWHPLHNQYVQLALCLPVFIIGLEHFGGSAIRALKAGTSNMDVLIILGSGAAFIYSLTGTIFNLGENYLFYESAASIFTLVMLGNVLEKYSVRKTSSAVEELSKLQKITAKKLVIINGSESIQETDSPEIIVGDLVLVNSGDKIPADGEIIHGTALIDQSMITGESMPVRHDVGEKVVGGTLVTDGSIKIKVTTVGKGTVLSQIISLVKDAKNKRPEIQRLADKISSIFVPLVLTVSLVTLLISYYFFSLNFSAALLQAISVLVVACPCAMGLATPAAVMVGVGRAVNSGLLIKEAKALEKLANIKTIIFDKTGTLTDGKFKITDIQAIDTDLETLKSLIYSAELRSSHPLAKAITSELNGSKQIEIKDSREEKGVGLIFSDDKGNSYKIGSYNLASQLTQDQSHNIYILKNNALIGFLDLEDAPKPESAKLIASLKELGIESIILSGDSYDKCKLLADKVGINKIYAQKSPKEKLDIVDELQKNKMIGFVGDGINDAPALTKAGVGISLSSASQVAIQSAQILLVGGQIKQLSAAVQISRKTLSVIKQNLFWAFIYNIIAIPVAAFGFLTPTLAAFTMNFSDVIIVLNSLKLKTFKAKI